MKLPKKKGIIKLLNLKCSEKNMIKLCSPISKCSEWHETKFTHLLIIIILHIFGGGGVSRKRTLHDRQNH